MPTAPPTCWVVLTSADPTPVSWPRSRAVPRLMAGEDQAEAQAEDQQRAEDGAGVAAGHGQAGQPGHAGGAGEHAERQGQARPDPGQQHVRAEDRAGDGGGDHGQERQPGADRGVGLDGLQVVGQEQEHRVDPGAGQGQRDDRGSAVAVGEHPQRQQRQRRRGPASRRTRRAGRPRRSGTARRRPRASRRPGPGTARRRAGTARRRPGRCRAGRSSGRCAGRSGRRRNAAAPISPMAAKARLTYSVQRQFRCSVSRPPSSRPTAPAIPATAPKIANARPRAGLPANVAVTIASAAGASSAPNAPWAARPAARTAKFGAAPASAEAAANPAARP